jgi:hypothetical protein
MQDRSPAAARRLVAGPRQEKLMRSLDAVAAGEFVVDQAASEVAASRAIPIATRLRPIQYVLSIESPSVVQARAQGLSVTGRLR